MSASARKASCARSSYTGHRRGTRYAGRVSRIVKLMTANDRHVGTLHEIAMPDGAVPHSHPKDYTRRDCSRVGGPREQAAARGAP